MGGRGGAVAGQGYEPFGSLLPGRNYSSGAYRFAFNGQEKDDEVNGATGTSYTAEFWQYDPRLARRWNLDPKSNPSISSYATFALNPILFTDAKGDTAAVFRPDGSFWKIEDDGKAEWSIMHYTTSADVIKEVDGQMLRIVTYGSPQTYHFADPVNDPQDIKNGTINRLVFVSAEKMNGMLGQAGALDEKNRRNALSYTWNESKGKALDFSYRLIPFEFSGASKNPLEVPSPMLFIPEGDSYAHNHMNFGNFLWGAAGHSLGFDKLSLRIAAHVNSLAHPSTNKYEPQFDSVDDQFSIGRGVDYSDKQNLRLRKWSAESGTSDPPKTKR